MYKKINFLLTPLLTLLLLLAACTRQAEVITSTNSNPENPTIAARTEQGNNQLVTTVARINRLENGDVELSFNERQAIFTLTKSNPSFQRILGIATEGLSGKQPVKLSYTDSNQLEDLLWPAADEKARYLEWYRLKIVDPEPDRVLIRSQLELEEFNLADWQKWKVFKLCAKTVPSYAIAKTIFNYCAAQGCYLGPTQVTPCIPFEYVIDGCFARAHKMRSIIETKYGFCSEKVFSYGNLDVKADKWGGCCVGWWYHVAPLIRVKTGRGIYCYVIDPGMFNEPVLLSTWLAAQGNTTCDTQSGVTSYSIQPSSAYTPSYTTDPNYTQTNSALVYFNNEGETCDN
jgi:hypothetical protein